MRVDNRAVPVSMMVGITVRGSVKRVQSMVSSGSNHPPGFFSSSCPLDDMDDHDGHRMVGVRGMSRRRRARENGKEDEVNRSYLRNFRT